MAKILVLTDALDNLARLDLPLGNRYDAVSVAPLIKGRIEGRDALSVLCGAYPSGHQAKTLASIYVLRLPERVAWRSSYQS